MFPFGANTVSLPPELSWRGQSWPSFALEAKIAAHTNRATIQCLWKDLIQLHSLKSPSLSFLPSPLDHSLWRAVKEDEFRVHVLLKVQLPRLSHQEDIGAQLEDAVHVGQLLEHDGVGNATEELAHKLADDQNYRGVQAHDTKQEREEENIQILDSFKFLFLWLEIQI